MSRYRYKNFTIGFDTKQAILGNRVTTSMLNLERRYRSTSTGLTRRRRFDCRRSLSWFVEAAKKGTVYLRLRAYLRASLRAGM